jgi:glucose-6-phosphate dehydrogenase assembly protein OpcA
MASTVNIELDSVVGEVSERRRNRGDMNVATMTLVLFFDRDDVGPWACERTHALAVKHPSRVIVLDATQAGSQHRVASECEAHAECVKTRGDWIELGVAGSPPEALSSAVAALSLPEAPVALIWAASANASDPRFEALSQRARSLVYNSSVLDSGDASLRDLLHFAKAHPNVTLSDLSYLRLAPWQESIALFFDARNVIRELFDLRRVEITCGSDSEAYYLLGWLASRLEWTPCSPDSFCNRFGVTIDFSIVREGLPRRIRGVTLSSSQTQFLAQTKSENAEAIMLSVSGAQQHPNRCCPIYDIDVAALVERAILTGHQDKVFVESLMAAGEVLARRKTNNE